MTTSFAIMAHEETPKLLQPYPNNFTTRHTLLLRRRRCRRSGRRIAPEPSNADVVHDLLDLLDIVLQCIESLAQAIILQIQQAETGIQIGHKLGNDQRTIVVPQGDRIRSIAALKVYNSGLGLGTPNPQNPRPL